jgi:predicted AlkP superfamily pyrophosphatase or phosphodiesterase
MMTGTARAAALLALALCVSGALAAEEPRRAVIVSVDGLMPAYYLRADELGLRIPTLRRLMARGAVGRTTGVLPTVTYPSHTTLITGVVPRRHGVVSNTVLDPEGRSNGAWMWYASSVRVPTLVSAARLKALRSAAVSWPVSVGLAADDNLPEFWRSGSDHPSDEALLDALTTPGLLADVAEARGQPVPYPLTDEARMDVAIHISRSRRPHLLLLHLLDLDHEQHLHGPFSPQARAAVEKADAALGRLVAALDETGVLANTLIAVVSDHGFLPVTRALKPNARLRKAGLVSLDSNGKVIRWSAWFHTDSGTTALHLKDPNDAATLARVRGLFAPEAGRAGSGIRRILDAREIERLGGDAQASLALDAESGVAFMASAEGAYRATTRHKGTHGHAPDREELQAALILSGPGVTARDLGVVRMTTIAPTIARFLGIELSSEADSPLVW